MSQASISKKFIFNELIDNAFIFSLYENDYHYITQVFSTSMETLDPDLSHLETAFKQNDLSALKKAVHKIKPVFGFAGLLGHQEKISKFEKKCAMVTGTGYIVADYNELVQVIRDGKKIIQEEYIRLTAFTK